MERLVPKQFHSRLVKISRVGDYLTKKYEDDILVKYCELEDALKNPQKKYKRWFDPKIEFIGDEPSHGYTFNVKDSKGFAWLEGDWRKITHFHNYSTQDIKVNPIVSVDGKTWKLERQVHVVSEIPYYDRSKVKNYFLPKGMESVTWFYANSIEEACSFLTQNWALNSGPIPDDLRSCLTDYSSMMNFVLGE